jgi:type III secretion protein S
MGDTLYLFKAGMMLATLLSAPVLIVVVVLGVAVSLLQAAFQMQDQTLPLLVKLMATVLILALSWAWMSGQLIEYSREVFNRIEGISAKR